MATISENLQTIKDSTDAIKQAIIDKGGTIEGDITTWASAINGISGGGGSSDEEYVFTGTISYNMTEITISGYLNKVPATGINYLLILSRNQSGLCNGGYYISSAGSYTLTLDFNEPVSSITMPAICILNNNGDIYTVIPVTLSLQSGGSPN